jgi:putative phosphoribosyl transferase
MDPRHRSFRDRADAGTALAQRLDHLAGQPGLIVLALPRGGVPVAHEVARTLGCPLDVMLVRKLGVPGFEELAMGALASGGLRVMNDEVLRELRIAAAAVDAVVSEEQRELERRERSFRGDKPPLDLRGRTVVLVDDGLATGSTMKAAVQAVRTSNPARVIVAVPVASGAACSELAAMVDEIVCLETPPSFRAVGQWYEDFSQTSDAEVRELLHLPVAGPS